MKGHSVFPKAPALLKPHHQIILYHIRDIRWEGGFSPLQRCSLCILLPQSTGPTGHSLGESYKDVVSGSVLVA